MYVWTKGGPIEMEPEAAATVAVILLLILFFISQSDINRKKENVKIADQAQQQEWALYVLPEEGIKISYRKHSTGTMSNEPFLVPAESEAREKDGVIVVILPANMELVSELAYSHGAGTTEDGRVRMVIRPNKDQKAEQ